MAPLTLVLAVLVPAALATAPIVGHDGYGRATLGALAAALLTTGFVAAVLWERQVLFS